MKDRNIAFKPAGSIVIASSRLRAYSPIQHLKKEGMNVEIFDLQNIDTYQIVVFQKAYTEEDLELAHHLKVAGCKIVLDQCDNHFIYDSSDKDLVGRAERMKKMAVMADFITASTPQIAKLYPEKITFVVPDYVELPKSSLFSALSAKLKFGRMLPKNSIKMVWFGNAGSLNPRFGMCDIADKIDALNSISEHHKIHLTIISNSRDAFDKYFDRNLNFTTTYIKWKQQEFEQIIKLHDLCLLPIDINPFTVCKTNNRLALALLLTIPTIADEIPSYSEFRDFVRFGNWEKNLLDLIYDLPAEKERSKKGRSYILEKYSNASVTNEWLNTLNNICILSN